MEIQVQATDSTPVAADDTRPRSWRITIDMEATEDPTGHVWGLLINERFESLLRLYGQGPDIQADEGEFWSLLVDVGKIMGRLDMVTTALMWAARDTYAMSWGEIESAMETPRGTIRKAVERTRTAHARRGLWRDEAGVHRERSHEVAELRAAARAAELSARRRPGDRIGYRLDEGSEITQNTRDLQEQVRTSLGDHGNDFDVPGIVDELRQNYGAVNDVDEVPSDEFWTIVRKHEQ